MVNNLNEQLKTRNEIINYLTCCNAHVEWDDSQIRQIADFINLKFKDSEFEFNPSKNNLILKDSQILNIGNLLQAITDERGRQLLKWGIQEHPLLYWQSIAKEEIGEFTKEVNDHYAGETKDLTKMKYELMQAITVLCNIYDMLSKEPQ